MGELQKRIYAIIRETIKPTSEVAITQKVVVNNKLMELVVEMAKEFPNRELYNIAETSPFFDDVIKWFEKWFGKELSEKSKE